jgi:hypothetical protein
MGVMRYDYDIKVEMRVAFSVSIWILITDSLPINGFSSTITKH